MKNIFEDEKSKFLFAKKLNKKMTNDILKIQLNLIKIWKSMTFPIISSFVSILYYQN